MEIFNKSALNFYLIGRYYLWTGELIFKLRTAYHFYRARDDPPACPNASAHLAVVEVVFSQINGPQSHMAVYLCPALIFAC